MMNVEVDKVRMLSGNLRFKILERDEFKCIYCGSTSREEELHVDHIFPHSKGGKTDVWNLVTACSTCNVGKKAMVLDEDTQKEILNIVKARNKGKGYRKTSDLKPRKKKMTKIKTSTTKQYDGRSVLSLVYDVSKQSDRLVLGKYFLDQMSELELAVTFEVAERSWKMLDELSKSCRDEFSKKDMGVFRRGDTDKYMFRAQFTSDEVESLFALEPKELLFEFAVGEYYPDTTAIRTHEYVRHAHNESRVGFRTNVKEGDLNHFGLTMFAVSWFDTIADTVVVEYNYNRISLFISYLEYLEWQVDNPCEKN